jgi:glutamate synthase (ferredoxin)
MTPWERPPFGLYHPNQERDACGVGFVAHSNGKPTHDVLLMALQALAHCEHRGAVSADGLTGDGAGVMTQLPHDFFREELPASMAAAVVPGQYGVGVFFLPPTKKQATACKEAAESCVDEFGIGRIGWRPVPINEMVLGEKARRTCPHIEQLFVRKPPEIDAEQFERKLYLVRRRYENRARREGFGPTYVCSFSSKTLVYKGLMVARQLGVFFPDLAEESFTTALAIFHQRYSTNTHPTWHLAHPFRMLAHNGEINTINGNVLRMKAREPDLRGGGWTKDELDELQPMIQDGGSDSACLDNAIELLVVSGRTPMHAITMLMPEAYKTSPDVDDDLRAFYDYHGGLVEPWDGPAAVACSDGRYAVAALDRNGLRPARYWITHDGLVVVGSEAGLVHLAPERIKEKGRLGPGRMIAVDTERHEILTDKTIKERLAHRRPYREWVGNIISPKELELPQADAAELPSLPDDDFTRVQKIFGYGEEDVERVLLPMAKEGKEPVGSMGDDTPIAVLSAQPQPLYRYFKQLFAQVTNPPIDPLREKMVMSLDMQIGARGFLLEEDPKAIQLIRFPSPLINEKELAWLRSSKDVPFESVTLDCTFSAADGPDGLEPALEALALQAESSIQRGTWLIVLSDRNVGPNRAPIPMLLAVGAVNHRLMRSRVRMKAAIVAETGDVREDHHVACLIGYGASCVCPYVVTATLDRLAADPAHGLTPETAWSNYKAAIDGGILKILAKMGISTLASYRGSQIFEILGLSNDVVARHFTGTPSRIGGVGMRELGRDVLRFHAEALAEPSTLRDRGNYHYLSKGGEYHAFNPLVFKALHKAVKTNDPKEYEKYAKLCDERPATNIRDALAWKKAARPIPLEEVEPAEEIARRFCTQAMSHGAVSRETHEILAIAMNRLGGKSNSGEGGEDRRRFLPYDESFKVESTQWFAPWKPKTGDFANSALKQVASARFGVTPEYLAAATEIEIKMAQGSKPGEGGQIPGFKVSAEIAALRRAQPGVTLISPPPHHDIYSIEDLSQLIYDLKRVNPRARICVKLVSLVGVGTVAAGVAKGYADSIQISGYDGGTGASPLASVKHAGLPWELGLAEAQQVLVMNDLRGRVKLRVDGGMKTGRDVVLAALLGAEEFGFGTAALVAAGCVMARRCHLNNCPVGIASQKPELRAKFPGTPEHVVNFMLFVAQQVRMILAEMGVRSLQEIVGRTDLLAQRSSIVWPKAPLDLSALLVSDVANFTKAVCWGGERNDRPEPAETPLDERLWKDYQSLLPLREFFARTYRIDNRERSVGARLSGEIARWLLDHDRDGFLPDGLIKLTFKGVAGQSFGAFCNRGMELRLLGEAQDYVGKGMHGGEIVLMPPTDATFDSSDSVIMGNTALYGATGGRLFAAGKAGERFCVRNSGALAVVEGCGDHGCEYMTNGAAVVLGPIGRNFGAGMSGGVAFVLDADAAHVNPGMVRVEAVSRDVDQRFLKAALERHYHLTLSEAARDLLADWDGALGRFRKVHPHPRMEDATAVEQDDLCLEAKLLESLLAADEAVSVEADAEALEAGV